MLLKLIACEVFTREVGHCMARSPHSIDVEFTDKGAHDDADKLHAIITQKIKETEESERQYDAILLGFGLCGNSTAGIAAQKTPIIVPRAHDCCTIFLGSKDRFKEIFSDRPSTPFTSVGYMEHGGTYTHDSGEFLEKQGFKKSYQEYVDIYGEESAKYLWETLHTTKDEHSNEIVFIDIPELSHLGFAEKCNLQAQEDGKEFIQVEGNMKLIKDLIFGNWNDQDFLTIKAGEHIEPVYDWEEIIKNKKTSNND